MRGFTLLEIVLVLAVLVTATAFIVPVAMRSLGSFYVTDAGYMMRDVLSGARSRALLYEAGSDHGVRFLAHGAVLFQGSSYALREVAMDEEYTFPDAVEQTGLTEVVFSVQTGLPSRRGTSTISDGARQLEVVINEEGRIHIE